MSGVESIRSLVFLDADIRRLLYDSKSILRPESISSTSSKNATKSSFFTKSFERRTSSSSIDLFGRSSNKPLSKTAQVQAINKAESQKVTPKIFKPQPDTKQICEMIFGSMSMVYHGCTLKIHPDVKTSVGGSCNYIMISYLSQFDPSASRYRSDAMRNGDDDEMNSGLDVSRSASFDVVGDSETEFQCLPIPLSSLYMHHDPWANMSIYGSSCPVGSLGNSSDTLNMPISSNHSVVSSHVSSVSRQKWQATVSPFYSTFHDMSDLSMFNFSSTQRSKAKLGLAILFPCTTFHTAEWIHSHIAIIEGFVDSFKSEVERAFFQKDMFYELVNEATLQARSRFTQLIRTVVPESNRPEPSVWLGIVNKNSRIESIKHFTTCLSRLSNKEVKFLSLCVTILLTFHLSWVHIVGDVSAKSDWKELVGEGSLTRVNKMWAQLCDLFGIAMNPPTCNKIVVHGKNHTAVRKYLTLISYFIRPNMLQKHYVRVPPLQKANSRVPRTAKEDLKQFITPSIRAVKEWSFSDQEKSDAATDSFVEIGLVDVTSCDEKLVNRDQKSEVASTIAKRKYLTSSMTECESESSASTIKQASHQSSKSANNDASSNTPSSGSKEKPLTAIANSDDINTCLRVPVKSSPLSIVASMPANLRSKKVVEEWMENSVSDQPVGSKIQIKATSRKKCFSETGTCHWRKEETENSAQLPIKLIPSSVTAGSLDENREFSDTVGRMDDETYDDFGDGEMNLSFQGTVNVGSLQDSGFADVSSKGKQVTVLDSRSNDTSARSMSSVSTTSAHITSSNEMLSEVSEEQSRGRSYKEVNLIESEYLCAPTVYPCTRRSASVAHSLQGAISNCFSQDAMLQGLIGEPKSCLDKVTKASKTYFIVDSRPNILCVDVDKLWLRVLDNKGDRMETIGYEMTSKTVDDTLTNAYNLLNMGMHTYCCANLIDRGLHLIVSKSVALTSQLLDQPDPKNVLEQIGIDHSDLKLLTAVASCIRHVNSQE